MQYLNTFLTLLSKTQSRDKILRLVQYATIHSEEQIPKGSTYNVYVQIRRTRRWLRFFRCIEVFMKIKKTIGEMKKQNSFNNLVKLLAILQGISTLFFYLFDHFIVLGQLQLITKDNVVKYQPKSMKSYLWQNIFGAIKNLLQILVLTHEGTLLNEIDDKQNQQKGLKIIKSKTFEFIRNLLDIFVAYYYLYKPPRTAHRIGVIGIVTSSIGILQSLKMI